MSLVTVPRNDMSFCPGCSHGVVLENLAKAAARVGLTPETTCLVTDIGCIGISDRYFSCHTFHGLHGRSLTYAEGIKRVRPDLTVIVLIGDGGCGIGTAHLVHAARRGVGIKVLVCNNFNFGMTGGQHSPTTPECGCTTTTPDGVRDRPFDVCGTVMANGAAHVARCSALDADCVDHLERALRSPGFALVDLWELCVAYYVPANQLKPQGLVELAERCGLPFGVLQEARAVSPGAPEPVMATAVPPRSRSAPRPAAAGTRRLAWPARSEICVAGSAGQRIRSALGVIGDVLVAGGVHAAQQDDFPITVRKGHSISKLIVSDRPIRYIAADQPSILVLISHDGLSRMGSLQRMSADSLVVAEGSLELPELAAEVRRFDLRAVEKSVGKPSAALAVLSAALIEDGCIGAESLVELAESHLTGAYAADNVRAIRLGCAMNMAPDRTTTSQGLSPVQERS